MNDWYIEPATGHYKHKYSTFTITREVVEEEIRRLDPAETWYNTPYHINSLLNNMLKDFGITPEMLEEHKRTRVAK